MTRNRLIKEAYQIAMDDYGFIALHQQSLAGGGAKPCRLRCAQTIRLCCTGSVRIKSFRCSDVARHGYVAAASG